jgi:cobalamin biosynthesis protein CbiG
MGEALMPRTAVAGIGCRPDAAAAPILALLARAEALSGHRIAALAAPEFRQDAAGLRQAAAALALPLRFIPRAALEAAQPRCPTRSEAALRATGLASVAEACALATGGVLILPRIDGAGVTCALALEPDA